MIRASDVCSFATMGFMVILLMIVVAVLEVRCACPFTMARAEAKGEVPYDCR